MVGDVLAPPVQGPAHAPGHDHVAEVEHDLGMLIFILHKFNRPWEWGKVFELGSL